MQQVSPRPIYIARNEMQSTPALFTLIINRPSVICQLTLLTKKYVRIIGHDESCVVCVNSQINAHSSPGTEMH